MVESLPRRLFREWILPSMPRTLRERIVKPKFAWSFSDTRSIATAGDGEVRLLIAPANYASQAYYWARAAETLPRVSARNLMFGYGPQGSSVKPDFTVVTGAAWLSKAWAKRQRREIIDGFTHVLYEAEKPILPAYYDNDLQAEVRDLNAHGVRTAFVCHGTDIRRPSEHVTRERFSPFQSSLDGLTESAEKVTVINRAILDSSKDPKFVSTPDLTQYLSGATWLPTLTDPHRWESLPAAQLGKRKLVVVHIPSRSAMKGTSHIRPALKRLQNEGLITYVERQGVPYEDMPGLIGSADVVIDQVGMGLYGVASVEALLAGRVVVAQAGDYIRTYIKNEVGEDLPIVEANPETIYEVVKHIAQNPGDYAPRTISGPQFARHVHSAERAAKVLSPFLLGSS